MSLIKIFLSFVLCNGFNFHYNVSKEKKGKISFSSLNYYKSSFFIPKLSKVLFSSLNFAKRFDFRPSTCIR